MKYDINHEFVSISSQTATHRIILMHGWGADADDLLIIGKEIKEKINLDFEVISLRAPKLHPSGQGKSSGISKCTTCLNKILTNF